MSVATHVQTRRPTSTEPAAIGMALFMLTEALLFSMLFGSYLYLRSGSAVWPQDGLKPPDLLIPSINTGILLASSVPVYWADRAIRRGNVWGLRIGLLLGLLLGAVFLALQLREYGRLDFKASDNAYASLFFTITAFHGVHLFVGMLMISWVQMRAWAGHFSAERRLAVETSGWYWHFVDLVWIFVFVIVYLSPHLGS